MPISEVKLGDCMDFMRELPDNFADLAIVDPPYGINLARNPFLGYRAGLNRPAHKKKDWDSQIPSREYFDELQRVSKNQIIFGGNYFAHLLPPSKGWIIYDKCFEVDLSFADFELAWTSFNIAAKKVRLSYKTTKNNVTSKSRAPKPNIKIHPTQKPIALYIWVLSNYATEGDTILDTHLGSGSSRIAAYDLGFDFYGFELDRDYYEAQEKRFAEHLKQPKLFEPEKREAVQDALFG